MKKFTLLALTLALSAPAMANNFYAQADVGFSQLTAENNNQAVMHKELDSSDVSARVAVGMKQGQARYALDYTRFGTAEQSTYATKTLAANEIAAIPAGTYGVENSTEIDVHSIGASAYYDFATNSKFTPYVGARVSVNRLNLEQGQELEQGFADYDVKEEGKSKTNFGAGVSAGVSYQVLPALSLDVGAEYNYLGKIEGYTVNQYGAKAGVRYQF